MRTQFGARADPELSVDAGEAGLDGPWANEECGGDLAVGQPAPCEVGNALLSRGQLYTTCGAAAEGPQFASCPRRPEWRAEFIEDRKRLSERLVCAASFFTTALDQAEH